jgi:catechol 2,3-dioxygenase-like lactoylglutathione lyase family enzyme
MKIHELGHIVFYVSNLERSSHFYRDILGFTEIHRDLHTALYSSGRTHHELLLIEVGGTKSVREYVEPGLYHVGIKSGTTPLYFTVLDRIYFYINRTTTYAEIKELYYTTQDNT